MVKSEFEQRLVVRLETQIAHVDVHSSLRLILDAMSKELAHQGRIEIRGFGSLSIHHRHARIGRNPKTGKIVQVASQAVPHFKPGRELKARVNGVHEIAEFIKSAA